MTVQAHHCRNCGELLAGPYCSHCGQREGRGDLTFGEVIAELADEFFNWDSRIWRTLVPLVFRPGFLTAEFIAGRRARYVPPFRLYLIISFILFLVISLLARDTVDLETNGSGGLAGQAVQEEGEVNQGETQAGKDTSTDLRFDLRPRSAPDLETSDEPVIAPVVVGDRDGKNRVSVDLGISLADEDSAQWLKDLDQRLDENAKKLEDNPAAFIDLLVDYLPQMMFLLLPLFALLLKCCYLFSPFHYLQHLVFSLHFHSFAYLLYLAGELVKHWLYPEGIGGLLTLAFVLYLPLALRRTYGSGLAGAAGKSLVILSVDVVLLLFGFVVVVLLALALL